MTKFDNTLFPQGYAVGKAFFDRDQERAILKNRIANGEHSVITAPRRYGKTSLIKQVLLEMNIPGKRIDLLPATNSLFVNKAIESCFSTIFKQVAPKSLKAKQTLIDCIKNDHPELTLNLSGTKLEINTTNQVEDNIILLLVGLNTMAKNVNKRIAICFDEFQQAGELDDNHAIEASVRHAVESSTHVSYIFSGSKRHLLSRMFSDKSRPLYHLCELTQLDRIKFDTYGTILHQKAEQRWGKNINNTFIIEVLNLTKCHPYYVNNICRSLWRLDQAPNAKTVQKMWIDYTETQSNWISDDVARLTPHQRNILAALGHEHTSNPYGNEFAHKVKMTPLDIKQALKILIKEDFVYQDTDNNYKVLDPVLESYLRGINYFDFLDNQQIGC